MATRGMSEFRADGVNYTVNDPNIAKEFDATAANDKGDYVNYQGDLYRFTAAHAANTAWGSRSKTKVELGADVKALEDGKVPSTRTVNGHALSADVTVTKSDVGLGNVDNTSDENKPVSAATQAALDLKVDNASIENDLTGTVAGYVLDARQGKVLDGKIADLKDDLNQGTEYNTTVTLPEAVDGTFTNYTNGAFWENVNYKNYKNLNLAPNCSYYWSGVFDAMCGVAFYDEDYHFISGTNTYEFTVPEGAVYTCIGTYKNPADISPTLTVLGFLKSRENENNSVVGLINEIHDIDPESTENGVIDVDGSHHSELGICAYYDVNPGDVFTVNGYYYNSTYPLVIYWNRKGTYQSYYSPSSQGKYENVQVTVPALATTMTINGRNINDIRCQKNAATVKEGLVCISENKEEKAASFLKRKKIVWFGMSIPANGLFGYEHPLAYPQQVGDLLDATVINEAIGSSCMHCKDPARITEANPYGFNTNFEASSRCFTNTQEEMDWICEHWDSDIWTLNKPESLSQWWVDKIHGFGYEQLLDKYLTESSFPDLFVFDHGFNDPSDPNDYYTQYGHYSLYTFKGAMNFIIKRILDYNPYANIVIIGNYTTTRDVPQMQEDIAESWAVPIIKQWEYLGLTLDENVTAYGHWSLNDDVYEWVTDSTASTMSVRDRLVPDHVHPHTNPTGKVVRKMAEMLSIRMKGLLTGNH